MATGNASLQPTYVGHVATTQDALVLFEACLTGQLHHVPRRPHDRERNSLIRSGCVFIYEENASGIKRWTDGVPWSPSRILGNFLVYRELLKPFPPGEKKRATKRTKRPGKPGEPYPRPSIDSTNAPPPPYSPTSPTTPNSKSGDPFDRETERSLIGSLVDSYGFKDGGLVKKTMSVNVNGVHHHLVSYYKVEDVIGRTLEVPSQSTSLRYVKPRHELTSRQNFRAPLDELDEGFDAGIDGGRHPHEYADRISFDRRPALHTSSYPPHPQPPTHGYGFSNSDAAPYSNGANSHASAPASISYGAPTPAATADHAYYGQSSSAPVHHKSEDYGVYGHVGHYSSRYEPLSNGIGSMSVGSGDRAPPNLHPMAYPQPETRARAGSTVETHGSPDSKTSPGGYARGYYSATRGEASSPSFAVPEGPRWNQHNTNPRSEHSPTYQTEKGNYWPVAGNVAVGHGHYPNPSPVPHWNHPTV
ncbi:MAG: hypothetical protein M1825_003674 [Sarcosagium campestre]|nr:MAG: hypothetical protein M1825_003674 [Sarcosagium campestre]